MSQISVLGFRASSPSSPSSSSSLLGSGNTHWAVLISAHPPSTKAPKPKSRFFHAKISTKEPPSDSALFDMHKHQLRQQPFPIPLKEDPSSSTDASQPETTISPATATTATPESTPEVVSITTLNADSAHPQQLILRITASILPQTPQRLIPKLSHRLYNTPTYGPEDDWLRDALSEMHDGLLEPGFDVDKFVEYATSAAKDYAMYERTSEGEDEDEQQQQQQQKNTQAASKENAVLTLDYASHIARNAQVKAMLNQQTSQPHPNLLTPPQSPKLAHANPPQQQQLQQQQQQKKKPRTWLGFRISASPGRGSRRPCERHSFERQDDPYGGLM